MTEILILCAAVALLGWICVRQYRLDRQREELEVAMQEQRLQHEIRQHEAFFKRMDTACTDGETCDLCGTVSQVREMIDLADDVVLLCLGCAPMLRRRAGKVA